MTKVTYTGIPVTCASSSLSDIEFSIVKSASSALAAPCTQDVTGFRRFYLFVIDVTLFTHDYSNMKHELKPFMTLLYSFTSVRTFSESLSTKVCLSIHLFQTFVYLRSNISRAGWSKPKGGLA